MPEEVAMDVDEEEEESFEVEVKTDGKKAKRFMSPIKNEEDYTPQD